MKMLFVITICLVCLSEVALAVRTNTNEVTDLFDKNLSNKQELFEDLKKQTDSSAGEIISIKSFEYIPEIKGAENNANKLKQIKASELDNEGRKARVGEEYSFYDENQYEPDYEKSGNKLHQEDAEEIAQLTNNMLKDLLGKLKELDIDCKTVKGPIEKEPVYYIDIRREEQKNTEYDQFFCEEPKNTYSCRDELTLKCTRRGMKWDAWQWQTIEISGSELVNGYKGIFYSEKLKKEHFRLLVSINDNTRNIMKALIAMKRGVKSEQISTDPLGVENLDYYVNPYIWAWGGVPTGREKEYMFPTYRFGYRYRSGHEICEEWSETWNERCNLQ